MIYFDMKDDRLETCLAHSLPLFRYNQDDFYRCLEGCQVKIGLLKDNE